MPFLIGAIILVALLVLVWYISTLNNLRTLCVKIDEAESGIDVALAKRCDVLNKMLDICKGYMKHEKETLFEVIKMRQGMSVDEKAEFNGRLDEAQKQINITAEAYPELRSSDTFVMLQKSVLDVEEHLQAARRVYNSAVSRYNQQIVMFPASIVANGAHMSSRSFFTASETQREDVKMQF